MPPKRISKGSNQPPKYKNRVSEFLEVSGDVPYPTPPPYPNQSPAEKTKKENLSEIFEALGDICRPSRLPYPTGKDTNQPPVKRKRKGKVSETTEVLGDISFLPPKPYPSGKDTNKPKAKRTRKKKVPDEVLGETSFPPYPFGKDSNKLPGERMTNKRFCETIGLLGAPRPPPPPYPTGKNPNQQPGEGAKKQVCKIIGVLGAPRPPPPPYPFGKVRPFRDPPSYPGLPNGQHSFYSSATLTNQNRLPPPYPGTKISNTDASNNPNTSQKQNNDLDSNVPALENFAENVPKVPPGVKIKVEKKEAQPRSKVCFFGRSRNAATESFLNQPTLKGMSGEMKLNLNGMQLQNEVFPKTTIMPYQNFPEHYKIKKEFPSSTGSLASGSVTYSQSSGTRYASETHPETSIQMPYTDGPQYYEITEQLSSSTGTHASESVSYSQSSGTPFASEIHPETSIQMPYTNGPQYYEIMNQLSSSTGTLASGSVTYSQPSGTRYANANHPEAGIQMPYTNGPHHYEITGQFPSSTGIKASGSVTYSQSSGTRYASATLPEKSIEMPYDNILQYYENASQIDIDAQLPFSYESPASTSVLSPYSNKSSYPRHDLDVNESFYSQGSQSYIQSEHGYASPYSNISEATISVSSPYTNEQGDINLPTLYPDNAQWYPANESQTESHIFNKPNHNKHCEPPSYGSNCSNQTSTYQYTSPYEEFMLLPDAYPSLPQPDVGDDSNQHNYQGYNENYQELQYEKYNFPQSGIPQ